VLYFSIKMHGNFE